ncbi:Gfo/Idh/MocA family oxidoreductase [Iamia sp. SCSIO 61187]|uniref:Gfo/Idh/MocA family protein n=1 Tax=Iamia sp. SCSIO 61187 TaxID=2722752 RepID=UPI001C634127|nr:Gfo/Idh/MocA family oxidoreductase [Iamia sp. SCSIO 61187]QYG92035.1 Gfo/Idh/MocA family oxidoreductase [Iamia sp. SCSIO 61187]
MENAGAADGDRRIGVAVVGLGIGRLHLISLAELADRFRVVAVCDLDEERAVEVAGWLKGVRAVTALEEVLAMGDVDVVALCTPPHLHRRQVETCVRAGKDVVCEKPLVGSVREVDELAALEEETGRSITPVFQYRFGRGLQRLRALVDAGRTGRPFVTTVEVAWTRGQGYYDEAAWRGRWATELGGTVTVHAQHHIDMVLHVLGPPAAVWAATSTLVNPGIETEDCAAVVLRYADGSLVTVAATTGSATEISRLRFCFEHLTAESSSGAYTPGAEPWTWTAADPDAQAELDAFLAAQPERAEDFVGLFDRYADARDAGAPPPVTLSEARTVLEVLTAVYVSSRTGREVALPLADDDPALEGWQP